MYKMEKKKGKFWALIFHVLCLVLFYIPWYLLPIESYQVDLIIFISQMSKLEV